MPSKIKEKIQEDAAGPRLFATKAHPDDASAGQVCLPSTQDPEVALLDSQTHCLAVQDYELDLSKE